MTRSRSVRPRARFTKARTAALALGALCILCLPLIASPSVARGGEPEAGDIAKADLLFNEGRTLMGQGVFPEACRKLEQSFQIAPRLGTMLNLGACYERSGRLARALGIYERAATMAREAGRPDREKSARELAASLEPRVGKLMLVVDDATTGLLLEVDGEAISAHGGLLPIDPGKRHVRARAPNRRTWEISIEVTAGQTTRVTVPKLEAETAPPVGEAAGPSVTRTIGISVGVGLVVVGGALGTIYGLRAKSKHDESAAHCDALGCDEAGRSLIADAKRAGNISTGSFIGAGIGLVTSAVFLLALPASRSHVSVAVSAQGTTLTFSRAF